MIYSKKLSLHRLSFQEAVQSLLKIKPEPKATRKPKAKSEKSGSK
jgi:hypothetical protein